MGIFKGSTRFVKRSAKFLVTPGVQAEKLMERALRMKDEDVVLPERMPRSQKDPEAEDSERVLSSEENEVRLAESKALKSKAKVLSIIGAVLLIMVVGVFAMLKSMGSNAAEDRSMDFSEMAPVPDLSPDVAETDFGGDPECPANVAVNEEITSRYGVDPNLPYKTRGVKSEKCLDKDFTGTQEFVDSYSGIRFTVRLNGGSPEADDLYYYLFNLNRSNTDKVKDLTVLKDYHSLSGSTIEDDPTEMPDSGFDSPKTLKDVTGGKKKERYQNVLQYSDYPGVPLGMEEWVLNGTDSDAFTVQVGGLPGDRLLDYVKYPELKDLHSEDSKDLVKKLGLPLKVSGGTENEKKSFAAEARAALEVKVTVK